MSQITVKVHHKYANVILMNKTRASSERKQHKSALLGLWRRLLGCFLPRCCENVPQAVLPLKAHWSFCRAKQGADSNANHMSS